MSLHMEAKMMTKAVMVKSMTTLAVFALLILPGCTSVVTQEDEVLLVLEWELEERISIGGIPRVVATLQNDGENLINKNVSMVVNGIVWEQQNVRLKPGESQQIMFFPRFEAVGAYEISIEDNILGIIEVYRPAKLSLVHFDYDKNPLVGTRTELTWSVANVGDEVAQGMSRAIIDKRLHLLPETIRLEPHSIFNGSMPITIADENPVSVSLWISGYEEAIATMYPIPPSIQVAITYGASSPCGDWRDFRFKVDNLRGNHTGKLFWAFEKDGIPQELQLAQPATISSLGPYHSFESDVIRYEGDCIQENFGIVVWGDDLPGNHQYRATYKQH